MMTRRKLLLRDKKILKRNYVSFFTRYNGEQLIDFIFPRINYRYQVIEVKTGLLLWDNLFLNNKMVNLTEKEGLKEVRFYYYRNGLGTIIKNHESRNTKIVEAFDLSHSDAVIKHQNLAYNQKVWFENYTDCIPFLNGNFGNINSIIIDNRDGLGGREITDEKLLASVRYMDEFLISLKNSDIGANGNVAGDVLSFRTQKVKKEDGSIYPYGHILITQRGKDAYDEISRRWYVNSFSLKVIDTPENYDKLKSFIYEPK